ncbi:hypothetical protein BKA70DRAFT_1220926 [Coprinopsis sp. MPI-PUGE-AT-0042]|nr:hypothetical protein BKA70DRAFT_1220926 [Coprinopsis sp. MPI-PUGE-AT-0042]
MDSSTEIIGPAKARERSERFFFDQPDLVLQFIQGAQASASGQAEDTVFKVHSLYFRRESNVFQDMYQLPQGDAGPVNGSSEEHPLILHGVLAQDLECILRVMCPRTQLIGGRRYIVHRRMEVGPSARTFVGHAGSFQSSSKKNYPHLLADDPAERYAVAKSYTLPGWIYNAIDQLVRRENPVSLHEVTTLDNMPLILAICALRESCCKSTSGSTDDWHIRDERGGIERGPWRTYYSKKGRSPLPSLTYEERIRQDFEAWIPEDELP